MQSERIQQRIERLMAEADEAVAASEWVRVRDRAKNVLAFDPENADAQAYIAAAERALADAGETTAAAARSTPPDQAPPHSISLLTRTVNSRPPRST